MKMKDLSKHRNVWLGFAMVWMIIYHSDFVFHFAPFKIIKSLGYGGVDICFFASGLGCYYSLNKDDHLLGFMKRRILRLAPVYLCFMLFWLIGRAFIVGVSFPVVLGNLLGIQNFTGLGGDFNWYISALLLFYFLAPYFKQIVDRVQGRGLALAVGVLVLVSIPFWGAYNYLISVVRLPIFFIGMYVGKLCCERDRVISKREFAGTILAMLVGMLLMLLALKLGRKYLATIGLYWYPFILITPGMCLCLSCAANAVQKLRGLAWLQRFFELVGKYSFELYLVHVPIRDVFRASISKWNLWAYSNWLWLAFFALVPVGFILFQWYVKGMTRLAGAALHKMRA